MSFLPVLTALLYLATPAPAAPGPPTSAAPAPCPISGFTVGRAVEQRALEGRFDGGIRKQEMRDWMERLSSRPHHLGSPADHQNAEFLAAQLRSWGFDTRIEEFRVLFPTPRFRQLEMTAPRRFTASLKEPPLPQDPSSQNDAGALPPYNAYSIDGDVRGPLVYVNYGIPKDYDVLAEHGVDVRGKIVIARYGGSWRGIKPKVAAEHGAIGCILYSDPRDDGYYRGDPYPQGPWRNEEGAQRGSVEDMPVYPGDPLTPGVGATPDAKRLPLSQAATLTKIPVLPISYGDALPLLRALGGPVAPEEFRGALPITYHLGPGPAVVHLEVRFNWNLVPCYDVIGTFAGSELPDEWVIRGNHQDAWVFGAEDPLSGTVAVMEEARVVGDLARAGWRPKRTIVYAFWDGEEPGLLGSTEWVETHAALLGKNAVVYVNSDSNGRGFFSVGGSHTLEALVDSAARDVPDPERVLSVYDRARDLALVRGSAETKKTLDAGGDLPIEALGSGSDYSPFLQHLGIASLNLGFGGEDGGGSYHSRYDSFDHFVRFGDPTFDYELALVKTAGRVVLREADADLLPANLSRFAATVAGYEDEVAKLADSTRADIRSRNDDIRSGRLLAVADPTQVTVIPSLEAEAPALDFTPLKNAVEALKASAQRADAAVAAVMGAQAVLGSQRAARIDAALVAVDRAMLREDGLPGRPWYRHEIYAPGLYTGYGVKTLPAVREAIEQHHWDEAKQQIGIAGQTILSIAAAMDRVRDAAAGA